VEIDADQKNSTLMRRPSQVVANTFLIGAQKAGTTFIAAALDQSRDVCVSDPKEPHFFTTRFSNGFDFYSSCFKNPNCAVRLDASTTYSFLRPRMNMEDPDAPGICAPVPQRIFDVCPDARFIYVLRDPVKRAASARRHQLRANINGERKLSLIESFKIDPMLLLASCYADQIERYLEVFRRDQFLFVDFRRLVSDPMSVIGEICDFLSISPEGILLDRAEDSQHSAYELSRLGRFWVHCQRFSPRILGGARRFVPSHLKRLIIPVIRKPASIEFFDEADAAKLFLEDRKRVRILTGLEI
jgi:hypothetical protein